MDFPILINATDSYKKLLPIGRRQEVLMSAEYLLDGKAFRIVGTVKKSLLWSISDYSFINFIIVDELGRPIKDMKLAKRIYKCLTTFTMLFNIERHIVYSIHADPSYYQKAINRYNDLMDRTRPVYQFFKQSEEFYEEKVYRFHKFLVEANRTNIAADPLARSLKPILERAKEQESMNVKLIEEYKEMVQEFLQISHQRTLLVLQNDEVFPIIKLILDTARARKEISLEDFTQEIQLIRDILTGSREAINQSRISHGVEFGTNKIEEIINHIIPIKDRGRMIDEISERQFDGHWLVGKVKS